MPDERSTSHRASSPRPVDGKGTGDRGQTSRAIQRPGAGPFGAGQVAVVNIPLLNMAADLASARFVAALKHGDLLTLNEPHPRGAGKAYFATVLKTGDAQYLGRTGVVHIKWVRPVSQDEHRTVPDQPPPTQPPPSVSSLPVESYVDNFTEAIYDPDYRLKEEKYSPTNWLRLHYGDGAEIDVHLSKISDTARMNFRQAIAQAVLGDEGRVFPAEMNPQTTPRLWAAKRQALEIQAGLTNELIKLSLAAVMFIITMSSMPAGKPGGEGSMRASSRRVQGSLAARARPRASRLNEIRGSRVSPLQLQEQAQALVQQLRQQGKEVVVNLGGAGAPHEPVHAINLNAMVEGTTRKGIPNLLKGPAEAVGSLFKPGQVDKIVGFRLSPQSFNWEQVVHGAGAVLRSGGKFVMKFRWADHRAALRIAKALGQAGFNPKTIEIVADTVVEATKL